jgi:hypothetical protein
MITKALSHPNILPIHTFEQFKSIAMAFAEGGYPFLIVIGRPGIGKSEVFARALKERRGEAWDIVRGHQTPLAFYRRAYESREFPIVIDDVDAILANSTNTSLFKALCDTKSRRLVEWGSSKPISHDGDAFVPSSFHSSSHICILANSLASMNANLEAVLDRAITIEFSPTAMEIHREIASGGWFHDQEVFDFIGEHLHLLLKPSFRFYEHSSRHRLAKLDWRTLTLQMLHHPSSATMVAVATLLHDERYEEEPSPEAARVRAFESEYGGSRATYFRCKKAIFQERGEIDFNQVREITLGEAKPTRTPPSATGVS